MGTVTIVVIIGGTIYAIKKSKDVKKAEGEEISLEEARKIVADREDKNEGFDKEYSTYFEEPLKSTIEVYSKADIEATRRMIEDLEEEAPYDEEEYVDEDKFDEQYEALIENIESQNREGDEELRYEPNSREARNQYIKMELAEWAPLEDSYQILKNLFDVPFIPNNDGDYDLKTRLVDYRAQFFGVTSRWTQDISYADIILYYARQTEFNCGDSVKYWGDYFLSFNAFDINTPSRVVDDIVAHLNNHVYFNEERQTFGLFGLTRGYMDQAIRIANGNIDSSVTYDIEFNEFLKSCI